MARAGRKGNIMTILTLVLLIAGLVGAAVVVRQQTRTGSKAADERVSLVFNKQFGEVKVATTPGANFDFTIDIIPAAGSVKVSAASVVITYDPAKLTLNSVTPGSFFLKNFAAGATKMLNKIDTATAGTIKINLGAPCTISAPFVCYAQPAGAGELAKLNFTAKGTFVDSPVKIVEVADVAPIVVGLDSSSNFLNRNLSDGVLRTLLITSASTPQQKYTLVVQKPNNGRIISYLDPRGGLMAIDCGSSARSGDHNKCEYQFDASTRVELDPAPDDSYAFGGWAGACNDTAQKCVISMDTNKTLSATFMTTTGKYRLFISTGKVGGPLAGGRVTSTPAGVNTTSAMEAYFGKGARVTLTATPDSNSRLYSWGGDCSNNNGLSCTLIMDRDGKAAQATFAVR